MNRRIFMRFSIVTGVAIGVFPQKNYACAIPLNRVLTDIVDIASRSNSIQGVDGNLTQYLKTHYGKSATSIILVAKPLVEITSRISGELAAYAPIDVRWDRSAIAHKFGLNSESVDLQTVEIVSETTKNSLLEYGPPGIYQVAKFTFSHDGLSALSIKYRRQDSSVLHAILRVGARGLQNETFCLVASSPNLEGPGIC